ncbi:hypothetical protein [Paraflavitalea pollutisoli]|uniref:hypothetical protein n=1 Tax=Paraflavitalea pollutisoli TaxID=3034143 RepID=UPI0023EDE7BD|nr:hypothetical protein [Paraflavitalea sp. H1-2-19X]
MSPLTNGSITIVGNPLLKTFSIPNLKSVDKCGNIEITNTLLPNLNMFANASGTLGGWGLTLVDNPEMTSVAGMKNIVATARLTIDQHPKLTSLEGINIPAAMTDWVSITRNDLLTDITAVSNKLRSTGGLSINQHKVLKTANFPSYEKGNLTCKDNGELTSLTLPNMKEADAVDLNHNVKLVTINLNALEKVPNSFYLWGGYETTQALTSFDLPALKTCGRFVIENCPGITNLDGFNNLETVSGDFTISLGNIPGANAKLKTINGFNKLTGVKYSLFLESASAAGYTGPLNAIKGFKSLKSVGAMLHIGGKNLTDISGFAKLESVGQDLRVVQTALTDLSGLAKLSSSGTNENRLIYITDNSKLTSLKGLSSITTVMGLFITRNPELVDIDGLEKVKSLRWGITIGQNDKLASLAGLANVEGTTASISITENKVLKNFCGITKLVKSAAILNGYGVISNAYNPTQAQIIAGQCSQ